MRYVSFNNTTVKTSTTETVEKEKEAKLAAEEQAQLAAEAKAKEEAVEQERIAAQAAAEAEQASSTNLLYHPFGADKNCSDFPSGGAEAQEFYIAAGGPSSDHMI